ncbi:hypothetical protein GH714_020362 [Hevea brasiliensis]|uniref:BZIP domain-containing protein n=1 Tax=Hevea brasiliensis TaxID=3981 RepID=A0A6A6KT74_HEVBR|nr:hypothetical protein GH714_020362 [Hevea brasiliensis]
MNSDIPQASKTVDDVWREIVAGRKEMKEEPDEMMTLEDFLAKTGAVEVGEDEVKMPLPERLSGGVYAFDPVPPSAFQMLDKVEGSIVGFGNEVEVVAGRGGSGVGRGKRGRTPVMEPLDRVAQQRQRRMIKNRESAARSRERKQAYQVELESLAVMLEEENEQLLKEKFNMVPWILSCLQAYKIDREETRKIATPIPPPISGGEVSSSPAYPWPFRPREAASSPAPEPSSGASSPLTLPTVVPDKGGGMPFINSNPAVPLPTGEVDSATIRPLPASGHQQEKRKKIAMELELGLKITHNRDDITSVTELRIAKDHTGPLFLSRETETKFILMHISKVLEERILTSRSMKMGIGLRVKLDDYYAQIGERNARLNIEEVKEEKFDKPPEGEKKESKIEQKEEIEHVVQKEIERTKLEMPQVLADEVPTEEKDKEEPKSEEKKEKSEEPKIENKQEIERVVEEKFVEDEFRETQDLAEPAVPERSVNMKLQEKPEAQRESKEAPPEMAKPPAAIATHPETPTVEPEEAEQEKKEPTAATETQREAQQQEIPEAEIVEEEKVHGKESAELTEAVMDKATQQAEEQNLSTQSKQEQATEAVGGEMPKEPEKKEPDTKVQEPYQPVPSQEMKQPETMQPANQQRKMKTKDKRKSWNRK